MITDLTVLITGGGHRNGLEADDFSRGGSRTGLCSVRTARGERGMNGAESFVIDRFAPVEAPAVLLVNRDVRNGAQC